MLDYSWIANAKIYNDSVSDVFVFLSLDYLRSTAHIALLSNDNYFGFLVY